MANDVVYAPWRINYIRSLDKPDGKCFLCAAAEANAPELRRQRLVLWQTQWSVVLINRFPYTNGHLLIAPLSHKAELDELTPEEHLDLHMQTVAAVALLKKAMSPQGLNVGINLGRCAGAGLPGHIHTHVVPRWSGDTNFMSVIGEVRVVPQAIEQLYDELTRVREAPAP